MLRLHFHDRQSGKTPGTVIFTKWSRSGLSHGIDGVFVAKNGFTTILKYHECFLPR